MSINNDQPVILQAENLSYTVKKTQILKAVSLIVKAGEVVAVVGPNGAGKSTLARCLTGVTAVTTGDVYLSGKALMRLSALERARRICYVPQIPVNPPDFTVAQYVALARHAHQNTLWNGLSNTDRAAVQSALEITHLTDFTERRLPTLSGGEMQITQIAAALAQESEILILDEPTAFLDPPHVETILSLIASQNKTRGLTILWVTHELNAALLVSHRIIAIKSGQLFFSGATEQFMQPQMLSQLYGIDFNFIKTPAGQTIFAPPGIAAAKILNSTQEKI